MENEGLNLKNKINELFKKSWSRGICYGYIMAYADENKITFEDEQELFDYISKLYINNGGD